MRHATHSYCLQSSCLERLPVDGDVMRPRDALLSSGADELWSVASLDDVLNAVDDDDNLATTTTDDDLPPQPSATTTTTTRKSVKTKPTRSVVRRNERERNRVKLVNQGFDRLRQYVRLPGLSKKKLSKVDTLRAAVVYIKQLQSLLAATDAAAPHHVTEQLLPSQHQSQHHLHHHHQQQQPFVVADNVTSPTSGFLCLSLTGINSPVESSYDAAATTFGLLATPSTTPLEPALCAAYSTDGACLPLVDVNDNNCVVAEPCPPLSHEAHLINMADAIEQQRRLSELTAWLLE